MARLWSSGFELNSTTTGVEGTKQTAGSTTLATTSTLARSGTYSLKYTAGAGGSGEFDMFFTAQSAGLVYYARAYFYYTTLPNATISVFAMKNSGATKGTEFKFTATGVMQLAKYSTDVQIGSNSAALNANQWYRLEITHDYSNGTAVG